jgi:hypothetical protein
MVPMKTEEILRYDRMYRAMRELLDADVIAFGFWPSASSGPSHSERRLRETAADGDNSRPCDGLSEGGSL